MNVDEVEYVAEVLLDKVWQGAEEKRALALHVARVAVAAHWAWGDEPGATDAGLSALRAERSLAAGGLVGDERSRPGGSSPVHSVRLAPGGGSRIPEEFAWHVRGHAATHWGPPNTGVPYGDRRRRTRCGASLDMNYVPGYGGPECDQCMKGLS